MFIGVAFGSTEATKGITYLSKMLSEQVAKRLPQKALTKYGLYNFAKNIAKWIGIKLTKDSFAKAVGKVIPIIGAMVSGSISFYTMKMMAGNLKLHLSSLPLATGLINDYSDDFDVDDLEYDESEDNE